MGDCRGVVATFLRASINGCVLGVVHCISGSTNCIFRDCLL